MAEGGRRTAGGGRDAALTWDVPPPLEAVEAGAATAARPAFAAVAAKHLGALVSQLLQAEGVQEVETWTPLLCELAGAAAGALSPTAAAAHGKLDPRHYIKVKRLVSPSSAPADSGVVLGVACRKSLAHKRMRSCIAQPRIMLLAGGLEAQPAAAAASSRSSGSGGLAGTNFGSTAAAAAALNRSSLSSFDALLDQEQQTLAAAVDRIVSFSPDVLLVERSVARYAQELLLQKEISLVLNVKHELLERVARCTGALVAPSVDQLSGHCIGFCKEFEVESLPSAAGAAGAAAAGGAPSASAGAEAGPQATEGSDGQHLVADAATLRRSGAAGAAGSGPRTLMLFRGCPRPLGSTILLRGSDAGELRRVKRVASFAAYAAYWGLLESALLSDQLATAAAAVLPGGCQPDAVAGLADAVASSSFLATAEARGRQAILSASPHVSVVLERGAPVGELELPTQDSEHEAAGVCGGGDGGSGSCSEEAEAEAASDWDDGEAVGSPGSSDSTQLWVLPAVAGAATFTVSGSQSQTEVDEADAAAQQQPGAGSAAACSAARQQAEGSVQQQQPGVYTGSTLMAAANGTHTQAAPGSPQDPLHLAAKELALQQLQLTGSAPPSPITALDPEGPEPQLPQQHMLSARGIETDSLAAQPSSSQFTRIAAAQQQQQQQLGSTLAREASWGAASSAPVPPGLLPYHSQQLWLTISCKNPAKGVLCEPAHAHCMQFYADTDLPLGAFLSAAAPSNRKCPHPQCGDGAPLHLRSFLHANGLVTLSSVRLPAGKELPDGRVWLWLRPTGGRGSSDNGGSGAVRRVALSPEAACLSFAHLLSLLFDARQLALGGASLQRDFVRYLGTGSTLLCLHFSPAAVYAMRMPPRCVGLLAAPQLEWLQEEVKALTEEADEAFGAIEYALQQQLRALPPLEVADEAGNGDAIEAAAAAAAADAEFRQMWLDTLADTRGLFLELVQDSVVQLEASSHVGEGGDQQEQEQAAARQLVPMVWELNKLRSMLAAVVLQWATCLQEGAAGSHAAPPSGGGLLSSMLATRRQAGGRHSRRGSVAEDSEGPEAAVEEPPLSPTGQAAAEQLEEGPTEEQQQRQQPEAQQQAGQPSLPVELADAVQPPGHTLQRSVSGGSLGQQFLEAGISQDLGRRAASELDFGAPSLVGGDDGSVGGGPSLATSPQGDLGMPAPSSIPTGLVARYVAMFDQRGPDASPGSPGNSPTAQRRRSQRTLNWVQASSPAAGKGGAVAAQAAASPAERGGLPAGEPAAAQQPPSEEQVVSPQQQPLTRQRSSLFRLDLTSPDPDLARALTPSRRRTSEEGEAVPATVASRLEQISARLGRMSLTQSFTERRRSSVLLHAASADQAALLQAASSQGRAVMLPVPEQTTAAWSAAASAATAGHDEPQAESQLEQQQQQQQQQQSQQPVDPGGTAAAEEEEEEEEEQEEAGPPSAQPSGSHFEQWGELLPGDPGAVGLAAATDNGGRGSSSEAAGKGGSLLPASLMMLKSVSSGKLDAIAKLQEAPMPATVAPPAVAAEPTSDAAAAAAAAGAAATDAAPALPAGAAPPAAGVPAAAGLSQLTSASRSASASLAQMGRSLSNLLTPASSAAHLPLSHNSTPAASPAAVSLPEKAPSRLRQLLGKLRNEPAPGQLPLPTGRVELSGRALLPGGADGMRVAVFDEEPTSIIAYCLATREYQQYLHDAVATILFGEAGQRSNPAPSPGGEPDSSGGADAVAAVPGSWQSLPNTPRNGQHSGRPVSSLVPALQQQQQQQASEPEAAAAESNSALDATPSDTGAASTGAAGAPAAGAPGATAQAAPGPALGQSPAPSTRTVTQEELAAEQSGDWQVLFCEQQLDCQLALEDPSPGMPWGRARFQVTAYYAPQFAELRRRCVAGGEAAFLASLSRCRKWASRGGKSAAYFARSCDKRYIVKQLSRSERQSFLEFAPDYFRYVATMLHRGQDTCLAKILGVYQVSVQYTGGGRGAPSGPSWGGKDGLMDLLITENVFYGREAQVTRIYDLKGSQRDRYAADDPASAGAVLLDENLQELNMSSPTLVGPRAYARLQRALWSDTGFLAGLGVMDYSLLVGVDKARGELVVGVIDFCRQYTWDKQVETWVKKSGILGGAGKDPTVISPKQYSRRFRIAMSSYITVVPSWEAPEQPLDPDAM